jgi:hypothetical protein
MARGLAPTPAGEHGDGVIGLGEGWTSDISLTETSAKESPLYVTKCE